MSNGNVQPYQGQRYRLTYPEKNVVGISPDPDRCTRQSRKSCCQQMLYTPRPCSSCNSTFIPSARPDPNKCLKLCKGIDVKNVNGCLAEQMQYRTRINNNGCLMEPSAAEYTNVSINNTGKCNSKSILTFNRRNPPPSPGYGAKYNSSYDPILWEYGNAYTY